MSGNPYDESWGGRCDDQMAEPGGRPQMSRVVGGRRLYYCCGKHCPGYPFKASDLPHPPTCVTGGNVEDGRER